MRIVVDVSLGCAPESVFGLLDDLGQYPRWTSIVHAASREEGDEAWAVELRGRVGPFARSKKLRMVRVELDAPHRVRFERRELSGRDHGLWMFEANVVGHESGCDVNVVLNYDGRLWSSVVERVLQDEIELSKQRLAQLVS